MSASTFSSIVNPVGSLDSVLEMVSLIREDMKDLFYRYVPGIRTVPLFQGLKFKPTWKALPTYKLTQDVLIRRMKLKERAAD